MPIRSPLPAVEIPDVALAPFVLERARDLGEKAALIDGPSGRMLTYGELDDQVRRTAGGLAAQGVEEGDKLALLAPNRPEYAVAFHATALAGGVVTTINPLYRAEEIHYQLRDSGARLLVTVPSTVGP